MGGPAEHPLLTAALVALCGVSFIAFGSMWPAGTAGSEPQKALRRQMYEKRVEALAELRRAGVSGNVDVVDFGDGVGLSVAQGIEKGETVLSVPDFLALDVKQTQSCSSHDESDETFLDPLDCQIERAVVQAVARKEATRLTGLLALLVMESRRGHIDGLKPSAASAVLQAMPEPSWQAENGLFAIDGDEFRVLGAGTSMERWREVALNETLQAHMFVQGALDAMLGGNVSLEEVRWAYLVLHAHGQWTEDDGLDDGIEIPPHVVFLWPLFLARLTPEWVHGVRLRHDAERGAYEAVATRALRPGEEVFFINRRISDASVLCFRGLWLSGRHRARFSLDVGSAPRDPQSHAILHKYGCGAQPLRLYLHAQMTLDPHFLSCMRMLVLAGNATKLQRIERNGWARAWPETEMVSRQTEKLAAELAISCLQQVLTRLSSSTSEIRQRYGGDSVPVRPTIRVREAETMIVVGLLKSMKELQLLSSNEYLFEALRETQRKKRGAAERGTGQEGWQQPKLAESAPS